jgi:hypothetical protein
MSVGVTPHSVWDETSYMERRTASSWTELIDRIKNGGPAGLCRCDYGVLDQGRGVRGGHRNHRTALRAFSKYHVVRST